jgi:hypothetical protein
MPAADVAQKCEGVLDFDFKVLTHSDGETYVTKLSKPYGAVITPAEAPGTAGSMQVGYALSGRTFTITVRDGAGPVTDKALSILVFGRK